LYNKVGVVYENKNILSINALDLFWLVQFQDFALPKYLKNNVIVIRLW
jgi:hypothetical protein